jgi:hypothetical protein
MIEQEGKRFGEIGKPSTISRIGPKHYVQVIGRDGLKNTSLLRNPEDRQERIRVQTIPSSLTDDFRTDSVLSWLPRLHAFSSLLNSPFSGFPRG